MPDMLQAIDPGRVPKRKLYTGAEIPAIGLGTFGSDQYSATQVAEAVRGALAGGYRHIDCASVYGNEAEVGEVLEEAINGGIAREELWITSKVWNDMHHNVRGSCEQSLRNLRLEYLDLYLIHWPFPNFHPAGCTVDSRSPDAQPYIHERFMETWAQVEALVDAGLVRHIGTSNMTVPKLELVLRDARIRPACNEMELHPHFQQPALFQFVLDNDVVPIGFCPIGSPARPERDRTADDTVDIEDPVIIAAAERLGLHPALVCIKWGLQHGQVTIPFSVKPAQYMRNLRAAVEAPLTDVEMAAIAEIDRDCRLVKGQVFLWKDGQTWEDLWDLNGEITPA